MNFDVNTLLEPISDELPEGENLAYDPLYDAIREARRADDPSLPVGVWERDLKKADWEEVADLCREGLAKRSKDLQLAVWLLEASIRLDGFAGLRAGLEMVVALTERFWDRVYPKIEGEDREHRYGLFFWMDHHLITPIKLIPVTRPNDREIPSYSFLDWEVALHHVTGAAKGKQEGLTIVKFNNSLESTPLEVLNSFVQDLETSKNLILQLDQRLKQDADTSKPPSLRLMTETVSQIQGKIMKALQERKPRDAAAALNEGSASEDAPAPASRPVAISGRKIESREDAYRQIDEIADYLMRHEPHSPTPYLLKRIRSWGDMTLFDLLGEVASANEEQTRIKELFFLKTDKGRKES